VRRRFRKQRKENMKNRLLKRIGLAAIFATVAAQSSRADFGTNITQIVTDATTSFGSVQTLVVSILAFSIAVFIVKKIRSR